MEKDNKGFHWMCMSAALMSALFFAFNMTPNYQVLSGSIIFSFLAQIIISLRKREESKRGYLLERLFEFVFATSIFYMAMSILKKCFALLDEKVLGIEPFMGNNSMVCALIFAVIWIFFELRKEGKI
jgi:hypothetical protein